VCVSGNVTWTTCLKSLLHEKNGGFINASLNCFTFFSSLLQFTGRFHVLREFYVKRKYWMPFCFGLWFICNNEGSSKNWSLLFDNLPVWMQNFLLSCCIHIFSKFGEIIVLCDCDISCPIYIYVLYLYMYVFHHIGYFNCLF